MPDCIPAWLGAYDRPAPSWRPVLVRCILQSLAEVAAFGSCLTRALGWIDGGPDILRARVARDFPLTRHVRSPRTSR
ncbi:hypothetical protein GCM10028833_18280 [Glycomyces tarimensis]